MTPVRLEPAAARSRVKHSTTEPLRALLTVLCILKTFYQTFSIIQNYLAITEGWVNIASGAGPVGVDVRVTSFPCVIF